MKRIGMLTSGGDCQALNATMRGVVKALFNMYGDDVEIVGFIDGYKGLIYEEYRKMSPRDFRGILTVGGTILGSSRQPFKKMREPDENGLDKVEAMKTTYRRLRLDCLVVLGGNGSQKTANMLSQEGLNVIGLPKTIDNDLWGTDMTFGFQSAVDIATNVIDCIHTTAASHNRIFMVEIMGHNAGWLTLNAGMAGGADIILIPEIPYKISSIIAAVQKRARSGHGFTIIAVAEGALSTEDAKMSKKEYKKRVAKMLETYPSISYEIAAQIKDSCGQDVRVTVPGHMQRGGSPCPYDRVLSSRLGTAAALMIDRGEFGNMVAIKNRTITSTPLSEVAGKLKTIDPKSDIIAEARLLGIRFGDE
jgi:6-phosphofructokinase 1